MCLLQVLEMRQFLDLIFSCLFNLNFLVLCIARVFSVKILYLFSILVTDHLYMCDRENMIMMSISSDLGIDKALLHMYILLPCLTLFHWAEFFQVKVPVCIEDLSIFVLIALSNSSLKFALTLCLSLNME